MAKPVQPLSATKVEKAKAQDKDSFLFDGGGLYLLIPAEKYDKDGKRLPISKLWKLKFRFSGKDCLMALGAYPSVSLEEARERRREVKEMLAKGIDPRSERKHLELAKIAAKADSGNTMAKVAMDWYDVAKSEWSPGHARTVLSRLQRDVFPELGALRISDVGPPDILDVLRLIEKRGAYETAHRIRTIIGQVFSFAIVTRVPGVTSNPSIGLSTALKRPITKNMAAILDPDTLGRLLRDISEYQGSFVVRCALQLTPVLFVRPGELRHARWADADLDGGTWSMPVEDMKLKVQEKSLLRGYGHIVPLSTQAIEVLRRLKPYTGDGPYVFPGRTQSRCMSENAVLSALRSMGWDRDTVTPHGFRATARTMLHETLGFSPDAIEAQLGHRVPDRLGSAYNRTKHLDERRRMMQAWADYLDGLKNANI